MLCREKKKKQLLIFRKGNPPRKRLSDRERNKSLDLNRVRFFSARKAIKRRFLQDTQRQAFPEERDSIPPCTQLVLERKLVYCHIEIKKPGGCVPENHVVPPSPTSFTTLFPSPSPPATRFAQRTAAACCSLTALHTRGKFEGGAGAGGGQKVRRTNKNLTVQPSLCVSP